MRGSFIIGSGAKFSGDYDDLTNKPTIYTYFSVWAEQGGDLHSNTYEWSFGNGVDTPLNTGVMLITSCELIGLGLSHTQVSNASVQAIKNNSVNKIIATVPGELNSIYNFEDTPIAYADGDLLNFITVVGGGTLGSVVTALFRKLVTL